MEVIKAKSAGFCFGVKKAMETVYQQIESNREGYPLRYPLINHTIFYATLNVKPSEIYCAKLNDSS